MTLHLCDRGGNGCKARARLGGREAWRGDLVYSSGSRSKLKTSGTSAMTSSQDSRKVLEKFIVNNKDLEELEAKISRFNIFEAIGMVRQEIKHSNFIHFLLNPSEKHQLRDLFLKKLLTSVFLGAEDAPLDPLEIAISNFSDAEVRREWKNIDLLIYSPSNRLVLYH